MVTMFKPTLTPNILQHRSYGGRMTMFKPTLKPYSISLCSSVAIATLFKPICVQENLSRKSHAIAPCSGGDNNGNYWGNGGGGGSGGDGEGEGEEEGFEGNNVLPMQHLNWPSDRQRKDKKPAWYFEVELEGSWVLQVRVGFDEVDIFSGKSAAEEQKKKEKMLKEMEIAAYMAKATGANVRLFYLHLPRAVSISRPIEVVESMAKIFYAACVDKLLQIIRAGPSYAFLQRLGIKRNEEKLSAIFVTSSSRAKATGVNMGLFYLPGAVSGPPIEVKVGSVAEIFYACSDKELQIVLAERSYSSLRIGVKVRNGEKLSAIVASSRDDLDGDGALKFVIVSFHPGKFTTDELLKKAFAFFDLNKSGHIRLKEVGNATTLIVQHR